MPFRVDLDSDLRAQWAETMRIVADGARVAVQNAVREGAEEARRVRTFQDRTGDLFRSIRGRLDAYDRLGAIGVLEAGVDPPAKYASFIEGGTSAHDIVARAGGALRWESADGVHFATRVRHPGTRPYPFMGPAYLKMERVLERDLELAVLRAAEVFTR